MGRVFPRTAIADSDHSELQSAQSRTVGRLEIGNRTAILTHRGKRESTTKKEKKEKKKKEIHSPAILLARPSEPFL